MKRIISTVLLISYALQVQLLLFLFVVVIHEYLNLVIFSNGVIITPAAPVPEIMDG
jgi:hypothetical protein